LAAGDLNAQYQRWLARKKVERQCLIQGINETATIKISILMPVYNPNITHLQEAVQSILAQKSPHWELCIVNDASTEQRVLDYLKILPESDQRISLLSHDTNQGISEATNFALKTAGSEYVLFMDQDDILRPDAISSFQRVLNEDPALDLIYADEDKLDENSGRRVDPHFKPEWSPRLLHSYNYIGHPLVVRRKFVEQLGGLRREFDGSQDHDLLLRLSDLPLKVKRVPEVLCSHRIPMDHTSDQKETKTGVVDTGCLAVEESFLRKGYSAQVTYRSDTNTYDFRIGIKKHDKISIIIPTKNNCEILKRCLDSIQNKSGYSNYEVIVIDNGSTEELALTYLNGLKSQKNFKVLSYPDQFNYPLINNFGAAHAAGRQLVFLNDDTEVVTPDWLEALLEYSQMPDVGAVGALLIFPNGLIQHAGIVAGMRGSASHAFYKCDADAPGYFNLVHSVRDVSAVTAACLMIKAETFAKAGGFNPAFRVGLNDVDLCLRLLGMGLYNVYTPHARLVHHESLTRGEYIEEEEIELFRTLYHKVISNGDPYYHPELSLERNDYSLAV
jgi:GT2 family glycosyltransferase